MKEKNYIIPKRIEPGDSDYPASKLGRLLVLSFFSEEFRRTTASQSILRNDVVAALADALLVPHASKNGKTWTAVRKALAYGQKIVTFKNRGCFRF